MQVKGGKFVKVHLFPLCIRNCLPNKIGGLRYFCKSYKISGCEGIVLTDAVLNSFAQSNWCKRCGCGHSCGQKSS